MDTYTSAINCERTSAKNRFPVFHIIHADLRAFYHHVKILFQINGTSVETLKETNEIIKKNTTHLDWGMVCGNKKKKKKIYFFNNMNKLIFIFKIFRGIVTSSSQVFACDNVPLASTVYLAILIFSPITAIFSLAGAIIGCFTGKKNKTY